MRRMAFSRRLILIAALALQCPGLVYGTARVTSLSVNRIGLGGGMITINGEGFATDAFSQFDPSKGNKIFFSNEFLSVECQNPVNWNFLLENPQDPSSNKITCDLPPRPGSAGSNWFQMSLKVDGVDVPNNKALEYRDWETPYLRRVQNRYGKPGDKITFYGRLFTKEYGNMNWRDNEGGIGNRREMSITGVVVGDRECQLTDELGNVYNMMLDDPDDWRSEGNITCLPGGTFIGPRNLTFVVSDQYGKSMTRQQDDAHSVNSKGELFVYHTLPELTSVSPNVGSIEGGTFLKIKGNSFDAYGEATKVKVGGAKCEIVNINNEELTCKTPAQSDVSGSDAGSRGLTYEMWVSTQGEGDEPAANLSTTAADYRVKTLDGSTVDGPQFGERNGYTARLSGYLVGPYDGDISFYLAASGDTTLYVSNNTDPANKIQFLKWRNGKEVAGNADNTDKRSQKLAVKEGELYYFEANHVQKSSQSEANNLQVYFWLHKTNYHEYQTKNVRDEIQQFVVQYNRRPETQRVTLNNMNSATEIHFTSGGQKSRTAFTTEDSANKTSNWNTNFENMLTVQCNYLNTRHYKADDYEDTSYSLTGRNGYHQSQVPAYCGKRSMERGTIVWRDSRRPIDIIKYPWFCFATRGETYKEEVAAIVRWKDTRGRGRRDWVTWKNVWKQPGDDWIHTCFNWEEGVRNNSWLATQLNENTYLQVDDIRLNVHDGSRYYQRDEITISELPVEIERLEPKIYNSEVIVDTVSVSPAEDSANQWDVAISPKTCLSEEYDFPLFGIDGAEIEGLNFDGSSYSDATELAIAKQAAESEFLKNNENATFTSSAWAGGSVTIQRVKRGSRAPKGSYTLTYEDKTVTVTDMQMTNLKWEKIMMAEFGIAGVSTYYWDQRCWNLRIPFYFSRSTAFGDLETIVLNTTNLITDEDNWKSITVHPNRNGGYLLKNPGGDFFRLKSATPEVEVTVNDFLSICSTTDCSFSHNSDSTPSLSSVSSSLDGSNNVILTIAGSGFTTGINNYEVMVGETPCIVASASTSEITCQLSPGPAGTFPLDVIVKNKGRAAQPDSGQLQHTVQVTIISNEPSDGSIGGGTTVNVTGTGFPNNVEAWNGNSVTIGGFACTIQESTFNWFTCVTASSSSSRRRKRSTSSISINFGGETTTGGSYTYDSSKTPSLTSFTPASASPLGGGILTITGSAFGAKWGKVKIGEAMCELVTWADTLITCKIPRNVHGEHTVFITVPDQGYADTSGAAKFAVNFKITDVSPKVGSTLGGTSVRIEGLGFGDCSNVTVNFGDLLVCDITECSDTQILCTTRRLGRTHKVDNGGKHPKYGLGYVWNPIEIKVKPGDTVNWLWSIQTSDDDTGINVHQTDAASESVYNGRGFDSGAKTQSGNFRETFLAAGTYFYSSDSVWNIPLFMAGRVIVEADSTDMDLEVMVNMTDVEAFHDLATGASGSVFAPSSDCTVVDTFGCASDPTVTDKFLFKSATCLTPVIDNVEITSGPKNSSVPSWGFEDSELTITGSGFSSTQCQNEITVGDESFKCEVSSASSSSLVCNIKGNPGGDVTPLNSLENKPVTVNVLNQGVAIMSIPNPDMAKFRLYPKITSQSINEGSWSGGSVISFTGTGLVPKGGKEAILVIFGEEGAQMSCSVIEATYTQLSCLVPDYSSLKGISADQSVPITIEMGYMRENPVVVSELSFTYKESLMVTADSMTPTAVTAATAVTVTGANFGSDASLVRVFARLPGTSLRRRRSVEAPVPEPAPAPEEKLHKFWNQNSIAKDEQGMPKFKCIGGKSCGFEQVTQKIEVEAPPREKRSVDEEEYLMALEEEDDYKLTMMICSPEEDEELDETQAFNCAKRLEKLSNDKTLSRRKRNTNEVGLIEMALLTENSYEGTVSSVSDNSLTFNFDELPAGTYDVIVNIQGGKGNAAGSLGQLTSRMSITGISPSSGSINGGQLITISGGGYSGNSSDTTVTIGAAECAVKTVSPAQITCVTSSCTESCGDVEVTSNSISKTSTDYSYLSASTPQVATATASGSSLTITGTQFGSNPSVSLKNSKCEVDTSSDTNIVCTIPDIAGGQYPVVVNNPALGNSNNDVILSVDLNLASVSPSTGSFGGGTLLTLAGVGFSTADATVTVCANVCEITESTTTEIKCLAPENPSTDATLACDVVVDQDSGNTTAAAAFTYDASITPTITGASPLRGGTGGGTLVTIDGTGFASNGNKVSIDGSICDIATESATQITCYTNHHNGAIEAPITVDVPSQGYARHQDLALSTFYYIDRWSSIWTWGGLGTPLAGELIVITEGQTILLDTDTPVLKFLLINGGTLMFDKDAPSLELQTEYILVAGGGKLIIGTEEEPYENKATITMHGNVRCTEMPVFGCKVIGIREGTLDLHGKYVPVTWTHLADTVQPGDSVITLKQPVTWQAGDKIVIATTSDRNSMKESEEHTIASIEDGTKITLVEPLKYLHISIEQTFGDKVVETRAEVALLTRNVLIQGTKNEEFVEVLPACEEEFNSGGAFSDAMQTCFAGKFGEELGSDEMGAVIIISPKYKSQGLVEARISYTELTSVGQAFRVGRYPIHFHITGNMNTSYIRGNAIHHSNNRACTLHDISYAIVEHNVAFNIKGLTFFLEDGVEMYNIIQYNLAVFTRMSNSLLNPDINPASFWIVNPNNKIRHNSCAGGTHLCFWVRPARVPDGPSYTQNFCPYKVPFDEFHNNTAHSMGWYGFWIMGQSNHVDYDPHTGTVDKGYCNGHRTTTAIGSMTTWNNKRGFEIVSGKSIRLENQTHMDHDFSAYEIFKAQGPYGSGPGIYNSLIVGHSQVSVLNGRSDHCTPMAIQVSPVGYTLDNVKFYNFGTKCAAIQFRIEEKGEASNPVRVSNLEFHNTTNRLYIPNGHSHSTWVRDIDGSLSGVNNSHVVGKSPINPPECVDDSGVGLGAGTLDLRANKNDWGEVQQGIPGQICDSSINFHRMLINEPAPSSLKYNPIEISNQYGTTERRWLKMAKGWQALMPQSSAVNYIAFKTVEHITNISYVFNVYGMHKGENYALIGHELLQIPDRFTIFDNNEVDANSSLLEPPTYETAENGQWYFTNGTDSEDARVIYLLSSKGGGLTNKWRKKRETEETERTGDYDNWPNNGIAAGTFRVIRCATEGCLPAPPPEIPISRPGDARRWSNDSAWEELGLNPPSSGETVVIPQGVWMILDVEPPKLNRLYIYGAIEVEDIEDRLMEVDIVFIQGGSFVVGSQETPFTNNFELRLTGNHRTPDQPMQDAPNCGAKALCVYGTSSRDLVIPGYIDMHGVDVGKTWVKLAATADAGATTIELSEEVSTWPVGAEIVISSTGWEYKETEKAVIQAVSGTTITLKDPLQFMHASKTSSLTDQSSSFSQQAEVGLLSRNVKIVGSAYDKQEDEMFGARVLVGGVDELGTILPGYGRFSNVEFLRGGQEGFSDNYDPRYTIAFAQTGDLIEGTGAPGEAESYVRNCGLNYNYNSAIGIFGSNGVGVENNVIFRHINDGIFDESTGTKITGNLVMMGEAIGHFKNQELNMDFYGCINIKRADDTILSDNIMAGCAQAGLVTSGAACDKTYVWANNEIHGSYHGIHLDNRNWFPKGCVTMRDFYVWRNYDYGLYARTEDSLEASGITAVDNGVGFLYYGTGPSADKHEINEDAHVTLENSVFVGTSDLYDCNEDKVKPYTLEWGPNRNRKWDGRFNTPDGSFHHTGVVFPIFMSGYNKEKMKFHQALKGAAGKNPALRGIMNMKNIKFDKYNTKCNNFRDIVVKTNILSDDVNWPIKMSNIKILEVDDASKLFINKPLAGKINPADCTDFDCDGMKKALIWDTDGSFKGSAGSIIPDSALDWDGNPAKGLGYYRVPKPMVTTLDGSKIDYAAKMPNTGIYRGNSGDCTWMSDWTAYSCTGIDHRLMLVESMDRDTKIRRLSPIAMLATPKNGTDPWKGYIDLVNGPQDFSCCSGYTCAERLSTFWTMIATGIEYELMMTSIPPQNFKFHLLHNEGGNAVRIKMWFPKQQRYDVYTEGRYVPPMNKDFSVVDGHKLNPPDDKYIPSLTDNNCMNYFDPNTGHLYIIIKGPATCDIKTQPVVVLKMGVTVDIDSFFDADSIVSNIAGLLGIDPANIRVTNIVREGSVRRKRSGESRSGQETIDLDFQIAEPPSDELDEQEFVPVEVTYTTPVDPNEATAAPFVTSTTTTPRPPQTTVNPNKLTFEKLSAIQARVANEFQTGGLSEALNVTVAGMKMEDPIPPPEEPPAYTSPEERAQVLDQTFAETQAQEQEEQLKDLTEEKNFDIPSNLVMARQPYEALEMSPIAFYPYLYLTNQNNEQLSIIGNEADPWRVTATLKAGPEGATLEGSKTVPIVGGFANFTDMFLSLEGAGYQLEFAVTYPEGLTIPSVESIIFSVGPRPLGVKFDDLNVLVPNGDSLNLTFSVWDLGQDTAATSEILKNQTWECELSFTINVPVAIVGETTHIISNPGSGAGVFLITKFEGSGTNIQFMATCTSPDTGRVIVGKSNSFILFPGTSDSDVGLLRKTSLAMMYNGPFSVVQSIVDAFNTDLGSLSCEGSSCPTSPAPSSRRRREATGPRLDMASLHLCSMPFCQAQNRSCKC